MFLVLRSAVPSWRGWWYSGPMHSSSGDEIKNSLHASLCLGMHIYRREMLACKCSFYACSRGHDEGNKKGTFLFHVATFFLKVRDADSREKQPSVQDAFAALIRTCWCHLLENVDTCSEEFCPSVNARHGKCTVPPLPTPFFEDGFKWQ